MHYEFHLLDRSPTVKLRPRGDLGLPIQNALPDILIASLNAVEKLRNLVIKKSDVLVYILQFQKLTTIRPDWASRSHCFAYSLRNVKVELFFFKEYAGS
jgi:hypothetical protein